MTRLFLPVMAGLAGLSTALPATALPATALPATALPATALGISQGSFSLVANGSMPNCLQRAREVLEQAGLRVLNTGTASVGAEPQDGSLIARCAPSWCGRFPEPLVPTAATR